MIGMREYMVFGYSPWSGRRLHKIVMAPSRESAERYAVENLRWTAVVAWMIGDRGH